jgi:hypothetical protein
VLWLHVGATETLRAVHRAVAERRAAGVDDPPLTVVTAPDHYLTGESSAVVRGLEGGPVLPAFRRRPAAVSGVGGLSTLVQNVETLARVGLISRFGGRRAQPGPVVGDGVLSVAEVPSHLTVGETTRLGAAYRTVESVEPRAVLIGGYGGRWVPWTSSPPMWRPISPATRVSPPPRRVRCCRFRGREAGVVR